MKRRWLILAVAYICIVAYSIILQSVPPVLSQIMGEFSLSHTQAGLLMSLFALPGIAVAIPAGIMADRFGQKRILMAAFIFLLAGVAIVATGNSFLTLSLGRLLSGTGGITLMVVAPQFLAQWFAHKEIGAAMGIYQTALPVGTILSLSLLSHLGESLGWRATIWISGAIALVALVFFAAAFAPAPGSNAKGKEELPAGQSLMHIGLPVWLLALSWMCFSAAILAVFTFTPALLERSGFTTGYAGIVTGAIMWPILVISPVVGYAIDRIKHEKLFVAVGGLATAAVIFFIPQVTGWALSALLLLGVVQALVPVATYAMAPQVVKHEHLGIAYGIINMLANAGIVIGPLLAGVAEDVTKSYQAGYGVMSFFSVLTAVFIVLVRLRHRTEVEEVR